MGSIGSSHLNLPPIGLTPKLVPRPRGGILQNESLCYTAAVKPQEAPEGPGAGAWGRRNLREEPYPGKIKTVK